MNGGGGGGGDGSGASLSTSPQLPILLPSASNASITRPKSPSSTMGSVVAHQPLIRTQSKDTELLRQKADDLQTTIEAQSEEIAQLQLQLHNKELLMVLGVRGAPLQVVNNGRLHLTRSVEPDVEDRLQSKRQLPSSTESSVSSMLYGATAATANNIAATTAATTTTTTNSTENTAVDIIFESYPPLCLFRVHVVEGDNLQSTPPPPSPPIVSPTSPSTNVSSSIDAHSVHSDDSLGAPFPNAYVVCYASDPRSFRLASASLSTSSVSNNTTTTTTTSGTVNGINGSSLPSSLIFEQMFRTESIDSTDNPVWNTSFDFEIIDPSLQFIRLMVFDDLYHNCIGKVELPCSMVKKGDTIDMWLRLDGKWRGK
jgi:hypothetical protein